MKATEMCGSASETTVFSEQSWPCSGGGIQKDKEEMRCLYQLSHSGRFFLGCRIFCIFSFKIQTAPKQCQAWKTERSGQDSGHTVSHRATKTVTLWEGSWHEVLCHRAHGDHRGQPTRAWVRKRKRQGAELSGPEGPLGKYSWRR